MCLRLAIHSFLDFHVHISVFGLGFEIVQVNKFLGDKFDGHPHVLIAVQRSVEVKFVLHLHMHTVRQGWK